MEIICNQNQTTGEIICQYPDNYNVINQNDQYYETIDSGNGQIFVVEKFVGYGDLMICLFLFIIILIMITSKIFDFWLPIINRFKKYEL